jgi:hypothetical protein
MVTEFKRFKEDKKSDTQSVSDIGLNLMQKIIRILSEFRSSYWGTCLDKTESFALLGEDIRNANVLHFFSQDKVFNTLNSLMFASTCSGLSIEEK